MDNSVKCIYNMIKELNKYSESTLTHVSFTLDESASYTRINTVTINMLYYILIIMIKDPLCITPKMLQFTQKIKILFKKHQNH